MNTGFRSQSTRQVIHQDQTTIHENDTILARTAITLEYASLRNVGHCPLGIYVVPSSSNLLVWDAVFFVHQGRPQNSRHCIYQLVVMLIGYYADSILKFRLTFPGTYPENPPAVDFVTDVFHPLISQTGSFNISPRFRPWRWRYWIHIFCCERSRQWDLLFFFFSNSGQKSITPSMCFIGSKSHSRNMLWTNLKSPTALIKKHFGKPLSLLFYFDRCSRFV